MQIQFRERAIGESGIGTDYPSTFLAKCGEAIDRAAGRTMIAVVYDEASGWVAIGRIVNDRLGLTQIWREGGGELYAAILDAVSQNYAGEDGNAH